MSQEVNDVQAYFPPLQEWQTVCTVRIADSDAVSVIARQPQRVKVNGTELAMSCSVMLAPGDELRVTASCFNFYDPLWIFQADETARIPLQLKFSTPRKRLETSSGDTDPSRAEPENEPCCNARLAEQVRLATASLATKGAPSREDVHACLTACSELAARLLDYTDAKRPRSGWL